MPLVFIEKIVIRDSFRLLVTKDSSSPSILKLVLQCLCEHWRITSTPDQDIGIKKVQCTSKHHLQPEKSDK
jgi:hypothetical protein